MATVVETKELWRGVGGKPNAQIAHSDSRPDGLAVYKPVPFGTGWLPGVTA